MHFFREAYEKKLRVKDELINEVNERLVKNETEQAARQHALHLKVNFNKLKLYNPVFCLDRTFSTKFRNITST